MTWLPCLNDPVPVPADLLLSDGVFNLAAPMLLMALLLVAPLAWLTRNRYRRWVMRLMGMDQCATPPAALQQAAAAAAAAATAWVPGKGSAGTLAQTLADGERRVVLATLAVWLSFALVGVWVGGLGAHTGTLARLAFAAAAALLALGPLMTNLPARWSRHAHRAGAVAGVLAVLLLWWLDVHAPAPPKTGAGAADDDTGLGDLLIAAGLMLGYWMMFDRRLRGQVQPLVVLVSVAMLAVLLPYGWLEQHAGSCLAHVDDAAAAGINTPMNLWTLALVAVAVFGAWLGFRAVAGLVWLIERRHLSEPSLGSALCLVYLAVTLVYLQAPEAADQVRTAHLLAPALWLLASFGAYGLALALMPGHGRGAGPQLLVLRVFSADQRKHALLDMVQARWRYLGPVQQIGGPDLVAMNIDPYEAAMYLSYRMHRLFLPSALGAAALQAQLDGLPCRDGRHRINEVFCFNTAWRQTVEQLMQGSDAIVLDVRGLGAQREGTSYEIGRLAACGLLARVVAIGDSDTDWAHVDALLRQHGGDPRRMQRIGDGSQADAGADADALLAQLMQAAGNR